MWGFTVRGSWRSNITAIFWPLTLMAFTLCLSCSLVLNRRSRVHSAGWWPFFTASYQHLHWTPTHQGLKAPSAWCGFPYHVIFPTARNSTGNSTRTPTQLSYIMVQHPLDLWNRMFDRHQAEINCHAVHRSLSSGASVYECTMGNFLARPISSANFRPRDFLSKLPLECVTSFRCIT